MPQQIIDQRFGLAVFNEQYNWDANGNLGNQTDWLNTMGGSRWLSYDGRDRLTWAWVSGVGSETFGWDVFDRLRTRNAWTGNETFNYHAVTHRLQSISGPSGTRTFGHDARGNLTSRPGFTHVFDAANRLTETPGVGRYEYDGHGRRTVTWRADNTAKVDFYTVDGKVRYKSDNREGGGTDYVYLGDQLVAEHKGPWRSSRGTIFTHTDYLGSPVVRSTNLGAVYSRDRRTSFGAPMTLNPVEAEVGYTGHIEDPEQGLVYMQQRYYDPAIAQFLSVDPVGPLADPSNHFGRYHYGLNNPYRFTDPDGRLPLDTLIDVGFVIYDGGRFLGAAAAAGVGAATGNEALMQAGLAGMAETGADLAASTLGAATPYVPAAAVRGGEAIAEAVEKGAAAANRAEQRSKGVPDSQLGPSGLPKRHTVEHGTRKEAREGAMREAGQGGGVRNDANPTDSRQGPHFQAEDGRGKNVQPVVHHEYPRSKAR